MNDQIEPPKLKWHQEILAVLIISFNLLFSIGNIDTEWIINPPGKIYIKVLLISLKFCSIAVGILLFRRTNSKGLRIFVIVAILLTLFLLLITTD